MMETFGSSAAMAGGSAGDRFFEILLEVFLAQRHGRAEIGERVAQRYHLAAEPRRELADAQLGKIGLSRHLVGYTAFILTSAPEFAGRRGRDCDVTPDYEGRPAESLRLPVGYIRSAAFARLEGVARRSSDFGGRSIGRPLCGRVWSEALRRRHPDLDFFGCAGPRMQQAGVRAVVDSRSIAVVGLVEVITHIPRDLARIPETAGRRGRSEPEVAILTDSPDFHLRLARQLKKHGIPGDLPGRAAGLGLAQRPLAADAADHRPAAVHLSRSSRNFSRSHGIEASYIGHPLTRMVRPSADRDGTAPALWHPEPGSADRPTSREPKRRSCPASSGVARSGGAHPEAARSARAALRPGRSRLALCPPDSNFRERISASSIQLLEGQTWDVLACADVSAGGERDGYHRGHAAGNAAGCVLSCEQFELVDGQASGQSPFLLHGQPGGRPAHRPGADPR